MTEKEILVQISQITRDTNNFSTAVEEVIASLESALVGKALLIGVPVEGVSGSANDVPVTVQKARQFLDETAGLPLHSKYTVPMRAHGGTYGKLTAFFALGYPDEGMYPEEGMMERLTSFAGEQLGMLLERARVKRALGLPEPAFQGSWQNATRPAA